MDERSKARVYGRSLAGIAATNSAWRTWMSVVSVYVLSRGDLCLGPITLPEEFYRLRRVIVCDLETSAMRRPWPALGC